MEEREHENRRGATYREMSSTITNIVYITQHMNYRFPQTGGNQWKYEDMIELYINHFSKCV